MRYVILTRVGVIKLLATSIASVLSAEQGCALKELVPYGILRNCPPAIGSRPNRKTQPSSCLYPCYFHQLQPPSTFTTSLVPSIPYTFLLKPDARATPSLLSTYTKSLRQKWPKVRERAPSRPTTSGSRKTCLAPSKPHATSASLHGFWRSPPRPSRRRMSRWPRVLVPTDNSLRLTANEALQSPRTSQRTPLPRRTTVSLRCRGIRRRHGH